MIGFVNFRARCDCALRIESDGFRELPADHPVGRAAAPWQPS